MKRILIGLVMLLCVGVANAQEKHNLFLGYGYSPVVEPYLSSELPNSIGPFVAAYSYEATPWLEVGGQIGYTHASKEESYTNWITVSSQVQQYNTIVLVGKMDFVWFRRPMVKFYSGIGGGIDWRLQSGDRGHYGTTYLTSQITAIGISTGKRLYGNLELGYGSMGIARIGIGYKLGGHEE